VRRITPTQSGFAYIGTHEGRSSNPAPVASGPLSPRFLPPGRVAVNPRPPALAAQASAARPFACHPQAWASAPIPVLLQVLLGFFPRGFKRRLHLARPILPDDNADGSVAVDTLRAAGDVEVVVERGSP
jgi:hypothetical protein